MKIKLLFLFFITFSIFSENYTREYNPTANVTSITIDEFYGEFDEIGRITKDLLATANFENGSLKNEDIENLSLTTSVFASATLLPSNVLNLDDIAIGDLLYASSASTIDHFAIGANTKRLYSDGSTISWADAPSLPWTDDTGVVSAASADDNMVIGDTNEAGTDGKAVVALYDNTIPTTSPAGGVQLYSEEVGDTYTKLLLHFTGSDGSTTFTDSSIYNHAMLSTGTTQIDTAQYKFNLTSAVLDGVGRIYSADSDDWYYGTGNFTIDFWVRFNSLTNSQYLYYQASDSSNYIQCYKMTNADGNKLRFNAETAGVSKAYYTMTSSWSVSTGAWYHIALVRNSTSFKIYINGTSQTLTTTTAISTNELPNLSAIMRTVADLNGWVDEYRISKGIARWTSDFTVATSEYGETATSELKVRDEAGNISTKSPHDFTMIPQERLETYYLPYSFTSKNPNIGKRIDVDMYGFLEELEKLSNKQFIFKKEIKK